MSFGASEQRLRLVSVSVSFADVHGSPSVVAEGRRAGRMVLGGPWRTVVPRTEKRKVDSSILSLTTSFALASGALTSTDADSRHSFLLLSSDRDCLCVTVVGRSPSHADRTACLLGLEDHPGRAAGQPSPLRHRSFSWTRRR